MLIRKERNPTAPLLFFFFPPVYVLKLHRASFSSFYKLSNASPTPDRWLMLPRTPCFSRNYPSGKSEVHLNQTLARGRNRMFSQGHNEMTSHGDVSNSCGYKLFINVIGKLVSGSVLSLVSPYLRMTACITGACKILQEKINLSLSIRKQIHFYRPP